MKQFFVYSMIEGSSITLESHAVLTEKKVEEYKDWIKKIGDEIVSSYYNDDDSLDLEVTAESFTDVFDKMQEISDETVEMLKKAGVPINDNIGALDQVIVEYKCKHKLYG